MTFLEELRASRRASVSESDEAQAAVVGEWLRSRTDAMFDDLRERAPTVLIGRMAFVTRYSDVLDVLRRNDVFSVRPYADAMSRINRGPNFLLGMDDGPEYQQQLSRLRRVFRREDDQRVRDVVSSRASQVIGPASVDGRLDLADDFGRLVPALVAGDYLGVPGPDAPTLTKWARAIFTDGFVNVLRTPLLSRRAMRASDAFRTYLDELLAGVAADRAGGAPARDDVLGRLLTLAEAGEPGLSDGQIRDTLLWCVAGTIDNVSTAVCRAMDYLLGHPRVLHDAREAVAAHDRARLRTYVLEALRFCTPTPVVTRLCLRPYTLSRGTPHETTIPENTLTFAGLGAAMMDETVVASPRDFRLDRPAEQYLHFGAGLHECLGRHVAEVHLTEMVGSLLALPGLRRARGAAGRLRMAGPFPTSFVVQFEPSRDVS